MRARIVVTGFEPFASYEVNPSAEGVRTLARDARAVERARFVVLPVTYRGAGTLLLAHAAAERAAGCLLFGVSRRARGLVLERRAYNVMDAAIADNAGLVGGGVPVLPGRDEVLDTAAPVDALLEALGRAGVPVTDSTDPGRFVCNATYYRALAGLRGRCAPPLLVHVPPTQEIGGEVERAVLEHWMRAALNAYLEIAV